MRSLLVIAWSMSMAAIASGVALGSDHAARFQGTQNIVGPVSIGKDQLLSVCTTDISVVFAAGRRGAVARSPEASRDDAPVWSSTSVTVYDSSDTTTPLPLDIADLIFSSGKGGCARIVGRDIGAGSDDTTSIMVVLTTVTEAGSRFDPVASGQLSIPDNTSAVGLLVPAIQSGQGASTHTCCACAPVCGCGICD